MRNLSVIILTLLVTYVAIAKTSSNDSSITSFSNHKQAEQITQLPVTQHRIVVIAHRGSHINVPENTLAAYETAIKEGADYVEIDLRTTKEGHLVIMHDESIFKMTGNNGDVKDLNYNEIRNLKIIPVNKNDTANYRVPDFKSVLHLCKGKINIYLDFKDADVSKTHKLIKEAGMEKNIVVYLNTKEQYPQWKKTAPGIPLMSSLPENMNDPTLNNFLNEVYLSVVDNATTPDKLNLVHIRKIAVWLDVQSKDEGPEKWEQALNTGVDGLQSDYPGALIKFLNDKGIR